MAKLLHKRGYYADKSDSPLAQFSLRSGSKLKFRVVVPSDKYTLDGDYEYVTYFAALHKKNGKKEILGTGLHGRPFLDEIQQIQSRLEDKVVEEQRAGFKRFCKWLERNAEFKTKKFNRRHVGLIRDLLTIKGNYYFK